MGIDAAEDVSASERGSIRRWAETGFGNKPFHVTRGWFILTFVVLLQWGFFAAFVSREVAPDYPIGYDQSAYLMQTYDTFHHIVKDGLRDGLKYGLSMNLPQGKMMNPQAGVLLLLTGPSRLGALSLNFFCISPP